MRTSTEELIFYKATVMSLWVGAIHGYEAWILIQEMGIGTDISTQKNLKIRVWIQGDYFICLCTCLTKSIVLLK